jgi:hypothetical protein
MKLSPLITNLFATCAAAMAAVTQAAETKPAPRPNIVFILCDDLGYGDIGVFYQNARAAKHNPGVPFFITPHIDTLARDGVKLQQHYCAAPVCAPSRASLLTGLTQGHANVRDNQFDKALADTHTLGTVLKTAGYATAAIGKWGLQGSAKPGGTEADEEGSAARWPAYPTKRGFDFYFGYVRHQDGHFHYPKRTSARSGTTIAKFPPVWIYATRPTFSRPGPKNGSPIKPRAILKSRSSCISPTTHRMPYCRTRPAPIPQAAASTAACNGPANPAR